MEIVIAIAVLMLIIGLIAPMSIIIWLDVLKSIRNFKK